MLATMVWSLASSPHLPVPATTADRLSRLAIHRKRSLQLKLPSTTLSHHHPQSWVASPSDLAAAAVPTLTPGAAMAATAAAALLVANPATVVALVVTARLP